MADLPCNNSGNDSADIIFPGTKCPLQLQQEKAEKPGGRTADGRRGLFGRWVMQRWMGQRLGPWKIKSQQGRARPVAKPRARGMSGFPPALPPGSGTAITLLLMKLYRPSFQCSIKRACLPQPQRCILQYNDGETSPPSFLLS